MKTRAAVTAGLVVLLIVALAAVAWAQFGPPPGGQGGPPGGGPPGGGGRGMDMQAMVYLEKTWTAVSLQLDCTTAQLAALKPAYVTELQKRNDALAKAMANRDDDGTKKALDTCRANLDARLKEVLTEEQRAKLESLLKPPQAPQD